MKKIFSIFCLILASFLFSSCDMPDYTDEINAAYFNAGGSSGKSECTYGEYSCSNGNSQFCAYSGNDLLWQLSETCSYGCDSSTGKCKSSNDSGSGSNSSSDSGSGSGSGSGSNSGSDSGSGSCSTIDGYMWSSLQQTFAWPCDINEGGCYYCDTLKECGYSDWRLPNINELRTLIKNCSGSQTGGACSVSDPDHLADSDWSDEDCYCEGKGKENNGGYYSKLGDDYNVNLWSSSPIPTMSTSTTDFVWVVYFYDGGLHALETYESGYLRCVRNVE